MMNKKWFLISLAVVLAFGAVSFSFDKQVIDDIRKKDVLTDDDSKAIKIFVNSAVMDIVYMEDSTKAGSFRSVLVSRKSSISEVSKAQYEKAFNDELTVAVKNGFSEADKIADKSKSQTIKLNLIILVSELSNTAFADLVMNKFTSSNSAERYAAISGVIGKAFIDQLNTAGSANAQLSKSIAVQLSKVVQNEQNPEILALITEFAGQVTGLDTMELLIAIADKRIAEYEQWAVNAEIIDEKILYYLGTRAKSAADTADKANLIQKFAQLYSYTIQRYSQGVEILTETQQADLVTVMVSTEQGILASILGSGTSSVKKAIEKKDNSAIMAAHDLILGSQSSKGLLADAIAFDYGKDGDNALSVPKILKAPPAKK